MDFNRQKARKEIVQDLSQLEKQREDVVEETRQWVRKWNAEQREMVLWILEEEVRDDNLVLSTKKKLSLPKVKTSQSEEIETGEDSG
tara:strand:+ start:29 stop:289 length:261 start_codon:yes stop_codon:yes gene_type:complete